MSQTTSREMHDEDFRLLQVAARELDDWKRRALAAEAQLETWRPSLGERHKFLAERDEARAEVARAKSEVARLTADVAALRNGLWLVLRAEDYGHCLDIARDAIAAQDYIDEAIAAKGGAA